MLDQSLVAMSLMGAHWVLQLLVVLSTASLGIMIERAIFYARHRSDARALSAQLVQLVEDGDLDEARAQFDVGRGMESRVLADGLAALGHGVSVGAVMESELARQRALYEKRLMFLGTLGNNAPFIGLFGTVLGIIRAFHDLSLNDPSKAGAGAQAVMAGISEALVATAVGLAVALPAVVAFNYFKSLVKGSVARTESLSKLLVAHADKLEGAARREVA
ncbi:MAG: MotA/TolQ/ExbB proton channel family protein [Myxococcales bacterium]|nr:MotA/TolQ/ExbB proton channel family protein [Myxococcales bacterium]